MKTFNYLLISLVLLLTATVNAEELSYLNENGELTKLTGVSTSVTSDLTLWSNGWYVVDKSVTISNRILVSGTVNLLLKNGVTLTAKKGINVGGEASFKVYAQSDKESEMGALNATGNDKAAGIGGGSSETGGAITINGGTVIATGGSLGAGIGGGDKGAGGTITINGGTVTATGSSAGIGGGYKGAGGTITINGGTVIATGSDGAGIGGGFSETGGTITINGGVVSASGSWERGAGIGGGGEGSGGTIFIHGGTVTATGGDDGAAGIGGGKNGSGGTISIIGGKVTAVAGSNSVGVGPGVNGSASGSVSLGWTNEDDFIYASSYGNVEAIKFAVGKQFYYEESGKGVVVENVDNIVGKTLRPFYGKKNLENAIVSGVKPYYPYTGDVIIWAFKVSDVDGKELVEGTDYMVSLSKSTIKDKGDYTLTVIAKDGSDYIGSKTINFSVLDYIPVTASTFTMDGSYGVPYKVDRDVSVGVRINVIGDVLLILGDGKTLTASKGIEVSSGNKLTIDGKGTLNATGEDYIAGIGCSKNNRDCGYITIKEGIVNATGGISAAGIGGGLSGEGGTITINGGMVSATTKSGGAGIGGGYNGAGGTITINGGIVTATGSGGAGIGGGFSGGEGGTITINGGMVSATTKSGGAGIGGGSRGAGGTITINGGTVTATATGGVGGAGIGGGYNGAGGTITINDGTVTATGDDYGAGIGGGDRGAGGTITINDGTVTATGGIYGAGIGGGSDGAGGSITINGGKVTANADKTAFGLGSGYYGSGSDVTLGWTNEDDFVYASSYDGVGSIKFADGKSFYYEENGKGVVVESTDNIGGKILRSFDGNKNSLKYATVSGAQPYYFYTGKEITLTYKVIDLEGKELVEGTDYTATFTPSPVKEVGDYTLTITAKDDGFYTGSKTISFSVILDYIPVTASTFTMDGSYGIPYKVDKDVSVGERINVIGDVTLILDDGKTLTASEGIEVSSGNKLTIEGMGSLNATGKKHTAGIGCGQNASGGTITINGGTVSATGGESGAGIGGGYYGSGGTTTINGGTVTATGGESGAGIGGGNHGAGATITINGGTVTAMGGKSGAGIGGGLSGEGGTTTINGGTVTATGGDYGAGIGGGDCLSGGTTTINGGTVTATGGFYGAGIGGGDRGSGGTITIIGGKVTANGWAVGIGPGNNSAYVSGSLILGWTNEDDFIYANRYGNFETIQFADGKSFYYEESGKGVVVEDVDNIGGKTLRPYYGKNSLKNAIVSGVKPYYLYTGDEIDLTYKVTDIEGNELVEGTDYTATFTPSSVKDVGDYTLTITAKEDGVYTDSKIVRFSIVKFDLENAVVSGVRPYCLYTGDEIALTYKVTDSEGKELVAGSDYIASLNNSPVNNVLSVKDKGDYTLTIEAKDERTYTGKKTISFTVVDGIPVMVSTTEMTNGIYRVSDDVTIGERIIVTGDVTLILDEGRTLTASKGIDVSNENKLTIEGMGSLNAADGDYYSAGDIASIGGGEGRSAGTITINGGTITATGCWGAGIGGGFGGSGGTITINGGTVAATGKNGGAGIGGGDRGAGGTITINGGIVTAISNLGAGIGGGGEGSSGTITINGGIVTAKSDVGAGIGGGYGSSDVTTINISDGVKKIVSSSKYGMCIGKAYGAVGSVVVDFISNGNIVTGAAKDAIFYDSGEGEERMIRTKILTNYVVSLDDDVKEYISVYPSYVNAGDIVTLTLDGAVDASSLKVNDGISDLVLTHEGNGKWTFTMPKSDVTVSARIVPTYSVTLPEQMILHSTSNVADVNGKYQSGTVVSFRARSFWTPSNVSDGKNALTPTDVFYSVTVGDADVIIDAEFVRNNNVNLADIGNGFIAVDGDIMTGTTIGYTVQISDDASVTLNNATIYGGIRCLGSATITLVGSNKTQGYYRYAGIWVGALGTTLTIKGEGSLEAVGGAYAAGIGCSLVANQVDNLIVVNCGNVVIEGGNITAKGGENAAGIGMSAVTEQNYIYYAVGDITIKGGTVNAVAGLGAAGIGVGDIPDVILNSEKKMFFVGKISIYDDIEKVDVSSISETVTYMHGETDVSANKDAYFNIVVGGKGRVITPKNEPDYVIAIDKNMKNGTVVCRNTARAGDKVVLNPVPARGYTFNSLSVKDEQGNDISGNNSSSTGAYGVIISVAGDEETEKEYSFMMPARNVVVSAEFVIAYEIVFDEGIKNGSVTADVVAPEPGDVVTLTAVPDEGYALAAFSVKDGQGNTVNVNDNTFVMPASKVIVSAVFSPAYNIAIDGNMENGSVTADKTVAIVGEKVSLMATPTNGYSLVFYTVKDAAGNNVEVKNDTFTMPKGDVTVSAVFSKGRIVYLDTLKNDYTVKDGDILAGETNHTISANDNDVTFTLYHATINGGITTSLNTTIILEDSNYVKGTGWNAGIGLGSSGKTLTIKGNGKLEAVGSEVHGSPGIGVGDLSFNGSERLNWGNLFIESGTITARGSGSSAGIGVGIMAANAISIGSIIINGGTVEAYGGKGSAGVGIGKDVRTASIKNIIFKGGTVTAKGGYGADADIGIGSDNELGTHSHLTISRIYFYHGIKEVSGNIKGISDVNIVYMNDGSNVTNNADEYFAITSDKDNESISKVRSLFNIGIDDNIANGSIAATVASSNGKAYADEVVTLNATPEFGYKVDFYTVKDAAGNNVEVNGNTFVMPLGDVTVSAKFVPKYAAITFSEDGKKATIDGEYDGTDALQIDENITVENVVFNREFTPNSGYATIMLPFDVKATSLTGVRSVIEFDGVKTDKNNNKTVGMRYVWCNATLGEEEELNKHPNCNGYSGELKAYTPYMIEMDSPTLGIKDAVTLKSNSGKIVGDAPVGNWVFRGTLQKKVWPKGTGIINEGRLWAFAAAERSGAKIGEFVQFGGNNWANPFRAYLVECKKTDNGLDCKDDSETQPKPSLVSRYRFADALAPTDSAEKSAGAAATDQPLVMRQAAASETASLNSMDIVIVYGDKDSEGDKERPTVIGRFNPASGEIRMLPRTKQTYDLKGRRVGNGKKAKGAYYRR